MLYEEQSMTMPENNHSKLKKPLASYFLACYLQISLVDGVREQKVKYVFFFNNLPGRKNKLNIFSQLEPVFS